MWGELGIGPGPKVKSGANRQGRAFIAFCGACRCALTTEEWGVTVNGIE